MLDSYKHRLRKAAAAFCAAAFLLGSVPAARAASVCPPPQVSAACAVLIDGRTGQTLYEKDADRRALIASTTKIMTGLLVCEAGETDRRVTVPSLAVGLEGSSMYLKHGDTLTQLDLLYGMMLHSGNDAALTLAISVSGSEQAFVRQMNLRAQALGLRQTHFANPHGLDSGENYSSARDLAMLAQAALQNQQFRTVVGTKTITCAGRTLTNHNKLLWRVAGADGVKTGFTKAAGRILVSSATRDGRRIIVVTIDDPSDWSDHAALMEEGFSRYAIGRIVNQGDRVGTVEVVGGEKRRVEVLAAEDFDYSVAPEEHPCLALPGPGFIYAPAVEGADAGVVYVLIEGKAVGKVPVVYGATIEQTQPEEKSFWKKLFHRGSG